MKLTHHERAPSWTLFLDEPEPHPALLGHLRKRINELVNAELRCSFGQEKRRYDVGMGDDAE